MDAKLCPICPLFWFCGVLAPETDVDKANLQNAALRAENHELRNKMADRGIDAGDRFMLVVVNQNVIDCKL